MAKNDDEYDGGGDIFDDIRDMFSQGKKIVEVLKEASPVARKVKLDDEPEDPLMGRNLRTLLENGRGALTIQIAPNGSFEISIGEGRHLKVYHGTTAKGAVDLAVEREKQYT